MQADNGPKPRGLPQYNGSIYRLDGKIFRGWLLDKRNLAERVRFSLFIDDELKGDYVANKPRKHLREKNIGNGDYGFDIAIEPSWEIRPGALFAVRPLGSKLFELVYRTDGGGEDGVKSAPTEAPSRSAVAEWLKAADSKTLADLVCEIRDGEMLSRGRGYAAAGNWAALLDFQRVLIGDSAQYERLLMLQGRAALQTNDLRTAARVFAVAVALFPNSEELQYYGGYAHAREGRHAEAIPYFRATLKLAPGDGRAKKELALSLRRAAGRSDSPREQRDMLNEAAEWLRSALEQEPDRRVASGLARLLYELGRNEEALAIVDQLVADTPDDVEVLVLKSRALVALNRVREALAVAQDVIKKDPLNQTAGFQLRALRHLVDVDGGVQDPPTFGDLIRTPEGDLRARGVGGTAAPLATASSTPADFAAALSVLPFDWLRVLDEGEARAPVGDLTDVVDPFSGFCLHRNSRSAPAKLWRREALIHLAESGLLGPDLSRLTQFESTYCRSRPDAKGPRTAILLSRHGSRKFGGGEHFIESMAEHYRLAGYDPLILGTRQEFVGSSGEVNGFRFAFVNDDPATLRRFILESNVRLVHAISGSGVLVAEALSYTNIPFIYGVHFWREALGNAGNSCYFDEEGEPMAQPEFRFILSRATTVYANSVFTRTVLEKAFGVRCPVVYSVPREVAPHEVA